jgi:protein AaeX
MIMIKEIDFFGIFLPPLLAYAALAGVLWFALTTSLNWVGVGRVVWHPSLFNTALYVLILAGCILLVFRYGG